MRNSVPPDTFEYLLIEGAEYLITVNHVEYITQEIELNAASALYRVTISCQLI